MEIMRKADVFHTAKIKIFPSGISETLVCSEAIFKEDGWEDIASDAKKVSTKRESASHKNLLRAARRASSSMRDIVLSNEFSYFVTFTLDKQIINRYNMSDIIKRFNIWADNAVRRKSLKYVIVPELHKDKAIHFHGFINEALPMVDSGTYRLMDAKKPRKPRSEKQRIEWEKAGAQKIFNCPSWGFGFSTAIRIYGDYEKACSYVLKYVKKQAESGKIGGRWFYSGGDLIKPKIILCDMDYREAERDANYTFIVPEAGCAFAMLR